MFHRLAARTHTQSSVRRSVALSTLAGAARRATVQPTRAHQRPQKVVVLGAGVIGITTAYQLRSRGFDVHLVESGPGPACGTSAGNAGLIVPSHAKPMATPAMLKSAIKWLGKEDSPLVVQPKALNGMTMWGLNFLSNCTPGMVQRNTRIMFELARYSQQRLDGVCEALDVEPAKKKKGFLEVVLNEQEVPVLKECCEKLDADGYTARFMTAEQCLDAEPLLLHAAGRIRGGMYTCDSVVMDCRSFTENLADCLEDMGVTVSYGVRVGGFETEGGVVTGVNTSEGFVGADAFVVACGPHSPQVVKGLGLNLPILPIKGYSVTLNNPVEMPSVGFFDGSHKVAYSPFKDSLRIAGTAEFAGHDNTLNLERARAALWKSASILLPWVTQAPDHEVSWWCGLRPASPDGRPIIGLANRNRFPNLYVNAGHGALGWTFSSGSATILADLLEYGESEHDATPFSSDRFIFQ